MFNSIFKIIYFIEVFVITIIRRIYTTKYRKLKVVVDRKTKLDISFLALSSISMIIPLVYVFSSLLDFANYNLPDWIGWVGAVLFLIATLLLWKTSADLGSNWTLTPGIRSEHKLITYGIYKYMRHPMYSAHLLWTIAQIMLLHNWIAGYCFMMVSIPFYIIRIINEEKMMIEQFGDEYRKYTKNTGMLFPKIKSKVEK